MTRVLIVAGVLAFFIAWNYFMVRLSGRPMWNPLWMAFTITVFALLYGIAGIFGYDVPSHNPFIDHPAVRVGHVVWPQVERAAVMVLVSIFFWWRGLKGLKRGRIATST